ncbi:MAG: hypothetical protein HOV73_02025 [Streptomyces sp.]|uniref:hypothetical protein n=1 Tax=Streptomyces sp. NBC_00028 TaxID=2975624 RepID=UPI0017A10A58|nr:hypothetical protein [Streptomyces sp.]NUR38851.1 hypothetical protein [Streptomyces sp.]NUR67997.1 hypothetical protein [Streptomyces sp.]NUS27612.1 hypothetical protein [Streptomyces sp.]
MLERTSTTERYARGVIAAVVAVAALVLAANAGPARASEDHRADQVGQVQQLQRD